MLHANANHLPLFSTFQLKANMPYPSVDALQQALTRDVFHYAKDAKKAAGRALGTVVEVIAFYAIKAWGLERYTAIERRLPEYGNPEITHNVEFSLHPSKRIGRAVFEAGETPITPKKILRRIGSTDLLGCELKTTQLLSSHRTLRNACTLYEDNDHLVVAYLEVVPGSRDFLVTVHDLMSHPFAAIECKRVGVEEGTKKGPQTIEKAKQGAYVARALSSVQKVRTPSGELYGVLQAEGMKLRHEPYRQLVSDVVQAESPLLLKDFVLTVGIVSNHGNWFATDDQNKEDSRREGLGEAEMTAGRSVNSQSVHWCTPRKYVDAVNAVFGDKVALDPCSNPWSIVGAEKCYQLPEEDGLAKSWDYPTIYVNPPYGADKQRRTTIRNWLYRCAQAHEDHGSEVLALVPVATNTRHWKDFVWGKAAMACFLYDTRLRFLVEGRPSAKGAPMSCAMIFWSTKPAAFERVFKAFGAVVDLRSLQRVARDAESSGQRVMEGFGGRAAIG